MFVHTSVLNAINILIRRNICNKIGLRKTVLIPNTSKSLQTTSAAEGQHLLEKQTSRKLKSLIHEAGIMMMMIIIIITDIVT
jgi:hypothetical protein